MIRMFIVLYSSGRSAARTETLYQVTKTPVRLDHGLRT